MKPKKPKAPPTPPPKSIDPALIPQTDKVWSSEFKLHQFNCILTITPFGMTSDWTPHMPFRGSLDLYDLEEYRAQRDKLLDQMAADLGLMKMVAG